MERHGRDGAREGRGHHRECSPLWRCVWWGDSVWMLYLTPGLSHGRGSEKHGGGSHIGETPCDEVRGGGGMSRQGSCRANGRMKEVKDRRSFHQSHHQGSSTLCVVPPHQQHADLCHVGLWILHVCWWLFFSPVAEQTKYRQGG